MRVTSGWLSLAVLLPLCAAGTAQASGGPVDEYQYSCQGTSGELIVVRLAQAASSETKGDALVYKNGNDRSQEMTSMATCIESTKGSVSPAVTADVATASGLVVCGTAANTQGKQGVRANNRGYRVLFWLKNSMPTARLELNGSPQFGGDLSCKTTPL